MPVFDDVIFKHLEFSAFLQFLIWKHAEEFVEEPVFDETQRCFHGYGILHSTCSAMRLSVQTDYQYFPENPPFRAFYASDRVLLMNGMAVLGRDGCPMEPHEVPAMLPIYFLRIDFAPVIEKYDRRNVFPGAFHGGLITTG